MSHDLLSDLEEVQSRIFRESSHAAGRSGPLMPWLLDRRILDAAWQRVAATAGANTPGPDGRTCAELRALRSDWLGELAEALLHDRYEPAPPRLVEIPKSGKPGKVRRVGILNVKDRVVHAALKQILEPVLEPDFDPGSFGFRPGRSVPSALEEARYRLMGPSQARRRGLLRFAWADRLDVVDCFDSLDHQVLLDALARRLDDPALLRLLGRVIAAGGHPRRCWMTRRQVGVVQGSALSPLLCNLYLDPLDKALADLGQRTQQGVAAMRYADDLLVLTRDRTLADRAHRLVRATLKRLHLRLRAPGRARTIQPVTAGFSWLGVEFRPSDPGWAECPSVGYHVASDKVRDLLGTIQEMTRPPSERLAADVVNLGRWLASLNAQLRQWRAVYQFAGNAAQVFQALDDQAQRCVAELIHQVTGKSLGEVRALHRARLPRGFSTWQFDGVQLVVLSSLAPEAPRGLVRRPGWMRSPRAALPAPRPRRTPGPLPLPLPPPEIEDAIVEEPKS